jgi:fluoride exporter
VYTRRPVKPILLVFFGSGAGGVARYLIGIGAVRLLGTAFPFGTLAVNLIGSFLITFIIRLSLTVPSLTPDVRLLLTTGVMGGLTTYSTFNHETLTLLQGGGPMNGALNIAVTVSGCLLCGFLGLAAARALQ